MVNTWMMPRSASKYCWPLAMIILAGADVDIQAIDFRAKRGRGEDTEEGLVRAECEVGEDPTRHPIEHLAWVSIGGKLTKRNVRCIRD